MKRLHWKTYSSGGLGYMSPPLTDEVMRAMKASLEADPNCYDIEVEDVPEDEWRV
jgi:hypothetical protein